MDDADEEQELIFCYRVVRLWRQPPETILSRGLATLPLAPLTVRSEADVAAVVREMQARLAAEAEPAQAGELWSATQILMWLSYRDAVIERVLKGVREMRESVTLQKVY
jgi:hypothetical protein